LLPSDPGGVQQELVVPACRGAKIYGIPDSGYSHLIFLFTGIIQSREPENLFLNPINFGFLPAWMPGISTSSITFGS
jgi:hypothetical protein